MIKNLKKQNIKGLQELKTTTIKEVKSGDEILQELLSNYKKKLYKDYYKVRAKLP